MTAPAVAGPRRDWRDLAACVGTDPDLFFPVAAGGPARDEQVAEALAVCPACPVRPACLEFADAAGLADGIWGGVTEEKRRPAASHYCGNGTHLRSAAGVTSRGQCKACRNENWRKHNPPTGRGRGNSAVPRERDANGQFTRAPARTGRELAA